MNRRDYFQMLIQTQYLNEWNGLPEKLKNEIAMLVYNFSDPRLINNPFPNTALIADKLGVTKRTIQRHHRMIKLSKEFADNPNDSKLQAIFTGIDKKWIGAYKWIQIKEIDNKSKPNNYILFPELHSKHNQKFSPLSEQATRRGDKKPTIDYIRGDKTGGSKSTRGDKTGGSTTGIASPVLPTPSLSLEDLSLYELSLPRGKRLGGMEMKNIWEKRIKQIVYDYPNSIIREAYKTTTEHPKDLTKVDLKKQEFKAVLQKTTDFFIKNRFSIKKIYMFQLKTLIDAESSIEGFYAARLQMVLEKRIRWEYTEKYQKEINETMDKYPDTELHKAVQMEQDEALGALSRQKEKNKIIMTENAKNELTLLSNFQENNAKKYDEIKKLVVLGMIKESAMWYPDEPELQFKAEMINGTGMMDKLQTKKFRSIMVDRIREFDNV